MNVKILPIILAGGVGTRLWPLSRETFPKQFLRLVSQYSLLQETVLRTQTLANVSQPMIVCNVNHYFISHDHLKEIGVSGYQFILEPFGKNTAAAIASAAQWALQNIDGEVVLLILPSDHYIADQDLFFDAVYRAQAVAQKGFLVTFGVVPTSPETGYGYIQAGEQLTADTYQVNKFIEKPPLDHAKQFVENGNFYWNSGMFMFTPQAYLQELQKTAPEIHQAAVQSLLQGEAKDDYVRLNNEIFAECPNISIDYAVMEKTHKAVVIPLATSWNDLGCWTAVAKAGVCDTENNVIRGEVVIKDSEDCFISSEGQMVAALGLKNQIIVTTPDVVLVASKAYSQEVKQLVHQLKSHDSHLIAYHKKQYDSSGYMENLAMEDHFGVEHFMLKPMASLALPESPYPLQWIVAKGSAEVYVNKQLCKLKEHQSLYVDRLLLCHVVNTTKQPLHLVRIQLKSVDSEVLKSAREEVSVL